MDRTCAAEALTATLNSAVRARIQPQSAAPAAQTAKAHLSTVVLLSVSWCLWSSGAQPGFQLVPAADVLPGLDVYDHAFVAC